MSFHIPLSTTCIVLIRPQNLAHALPALFVSSMSENMLDHMTQPVSYPKTPSAPRPRWGTRQRTAN